LVKQLLRAFLKDATAFAPMRGGVS